MTIVEKLKRIEPVVRSCTNGYNADIILEAIQTIEAFENPEVGANWLPGKELLVSEGVDNPEITVLCLEGEDSSTGQSEELESE